MEQIINGKRYSTDNATLVASDEYWDESNHDRNGRNKYLYKTQKSNFFLHTTTRWQGELDSIEALVLKQAKGYYESLPKRCMSWEEAFGEEPEEA